MVVSPHLIGVVLAALVAICLTVQALAIRFGTQDGKANDALVVVFVVNVLVFIPVVIVQDYGSYRVTIHSIGAFVAAGLTGTLLGTGFYYLGIEQVGASRSDTIKASQPLTATVLAIIVLGAQITPLNVIGIVLVVAGVSVLVSERSDEPLTDNESVGRRHIYPIAASVFFGMEPTFAKLGFRFGTPVFVGLQIRALTATIGLLTFLRWQEGLTAASITTSLRSKWFFVAGVANTLSLVAYYFALKVATVAVVIPIAQTSPLFVIGVSYYYLPRLERITPRLVAGGVCIVVGAVVVAVFG